MRWLAALLPLSLLAVSCAGGPAGRTSDTRDVANTPSGDTVDGIVIALAGDRLTLQPLYEDGPPVEVTLTGGTSVWKGTDVGRDAIEVGDRAFVSLAEGASGGLEASRVYVNIARADGRIVWESDGRFVIEGDPNVSPHTGVAVVEVDESTDIVDGVRSDLRTGAPVMVYGTRADDGAIIASQVYLGAASSP